MSRYKILVTPAPEPGLVLPSGVTQMTTTWTEEKHRPRVKPGVTGWAQISGWRGEIDNDEKIKQRTACDLYYIENWSLLFDLKILFLTPLKLLNTDNAY